MLVHALLAAVPLDADEDDDRRPGRTAGESPWRCPTPSGRAAAAVVKRVLKHPVLERARAAGSSLRREAPIAIVIDGALVDGQVDLAFEEQGGWMIVDFKTDTEIGASEEVYRRQVALYAHAIRSVTGQPARGLLLRV